MDFRPNEYSTSSRAEISKELDEIEQILGVEPFTDRFFFDLGKALRFTGTLHCETCLASLLSPNFAKTAKDIEDTYGSIENY